MKILLKLFLIFFFGSCANMVAPTGGEKDILFPQLLNINEDKENGQPKVIYFEFNEFIVLNNWEENFYISPPTKKRIQKKVKGQSLELIIEDPLAENTTYNLALSKCIKDLNEGNVLDTLNYIFSTFDGVDSLILAGQLKDAYTLTIVENAWVILFEESRDDSVIFKEIPDYIAKTDENGLFNFPNLKKKDYKMVALTDFDFIYSEGEKIAFLNGVINPETDSFISLFAFDPVVKIDSIKNDTSSIISDIIVITDSTEKEEILYGNLQIVSNNNSPSIFQLLQNEKVMSEFFFDQPPYNLTKLIPGKYKLKYIHDTNENGEWDRGNWQNRIQPEKVINYPNEIMIRSNWDLELEWNLE